MVSFVRRAYVALMRSDSADIKLTLECFCFLIYCLVITSTFLSWFGFVAALKKCQGGNKPMWCTFVVLNLELNSENVFFFYVCVLQQVKIQICCSM